MLLNFGLYGLCKRFKKIVKRYLKYLSLSLVLLVTTMFTLFTFRGKICEYSYDAIFYFADKLDGLKNFTYSFFKVVQSNKKLVEENERLKMTLEKMKILELQNKVVQVENESMKVKINFLNNKNVNYVTSKVVADINKGFIKFGIVNAGNNLISTNDLVLDENNFVVGRIFESTEKYSKFYTVTSNMIRVPVVDSKTGDVAVALGSGSSLTLIHVDEKHTMQIGDILIAYGYKSDQIFPVGVVSHVSGTKVVANPLSKLKPNFVSIISSKLDNIN